MAKKAATHRNKGRVTAFLREMDGRDEVDAFDEFAKWYTRVGARRHSKRRGPSEYNLFVSAEIARLKARGVPMKKRLPHALARWRAQPKKATR